jgi:hypothetical protein
VKVTGEIADGPAIIADSISPRGVFARIFQLGHSNSSSSAIAMWEGWEKESNSAQGVSRKQIIDF